MPQPPPQRHQWIFRSVLLLLLLHEWGSPAKAFSGSDGVPPPPSLPTTVTGWKAAEEAPDDFRFLMEIEEEDRKDLTLANTLILEKKWEEALSLARQLMQKHPKSANGQELLGTVLCMQGNITEGLAALEKALEISPGQASALVKVGDIHLGRKDRDRARLFYLKALEAQPDYWRAHQRLGLVAQQGGAFEAAISHYEKALTTDTPDTIPTRSLLGSLYNQRKQFQQTILLLSGFVSPDRGTAAGQIILGEAYLETGQAEKGFTLLQVAAKQDPAKGFLALGLAHMEKDNPLQALNAFTDAAEAAPAAPAPHFRRGEALFALKRFGEAQAAFDLAAKNGYAERDVSLKKADAFAAQGDFQEAITLYENLVNQKTEPQTVDRLATTFEAGKNFAGAELLLRRMTNTYPQEAFFWYRLGAHYGIVQRYDEGVNHIRKALALAPDNIAYLQTLAKLCRVTGDRQAAITAARDVQRIQPENLGNAVFLATVLREEGLREDAITVYRQVLAFQPDHAFTMNNLAVLLGEKGSIDEALKMARKAVAALPDNGHAHDTLGWLLHRQGNDGVAIEVLERASELAPDTPSILYHLGVVQAMQGKKETARASLKKALDLSGNFDEAGEARRMLEKL